MSHLVVLLSTLLTGQDKQLASPGVMTSRLNGADENVHRSADSGSGGDIALRMPLPELR